MALQHVVLCLNSSILLVVSRRLQSLVQALVSITQLLLPSVGSFSAPSVFPAPNPGFGGNPGSCCTARWKLVGSLQAARTQIPGAGGSPRYG